jgi:hypothetical protein
MERMQLRQVRGQPARATRRRYTLGIIALLGGVLAGSVRTSAATPGYCLGEFVEMTDPVLIVVDGQGSEDDELLTWPEHAFLEGTGELALGDRSFSLERVR